MFVRVSAAGARLRLVTDRALSRLGLGDDTFLLIIAGLIGMVTAAAAVGFHELIVLIRTFLSLSLQLEIEGKLPWQRSAT